MKRLLLLLIVGVGLCGCAQLSERVLSGTTAVSKLRTELGADIDLRMALQKDLARKNAQLEYVSDRGYSCGPNNPYFLQNRSLNWHPMKGSTLADRKKAREKFLVSKYADFAVIMAYGELLQSTADDQAARKKSVDLYKKVIDALGGYVPPEFSFIPKILSGGIGFAGVLQDYAFKARIIEIANNYEEPLQKARQQLVQKGIVKALTATEDEAFKAWDECALDRLFFLREFNPARPPDYVRQRRAEIIGNTVGESRSPVLLFINEYKTYLDEKEAFIGQRPDYLGLIDGIIKANTKIARLPADASLDDFAQALLDMNTDATAAKAQYDMIIAGMKAGGLIK